jgi:hypothetical protein
MSTNTIKGALPTGTTYANFVERRDLGVTSPVKPTMITRLPQGGPIMTQVYTSPLRTTVTYSNTGETVDNMIPTSPVRVTRVEHCGGARLPTTGVTTVSTHRFSPPRVTQVVESPSRVVTVSSPNRVVTVSSPSRAVTISSPTKVTISSPTKVGNMFNSRCITEHPPRFIGSTNLRTSTFVPAPQA